MIKNIILASSSLSRRKLLQNSGIQFSVVKPNIDEREMEKKNGFF